MLGRFKAIMGLPADWQVELQIVGAVEDAGDRASESRARRRAERQAVFDKLCLSTTIAPRPDARSLLAWYDAGVKRIHVRSTPSAGIPEEDLRVVLLHEIAHAYRDSLGHVPWVPTNALAHDLDRSLAERCCLEGDAQLLTVLLKDHLDERVPAAEVRARIRDHGAQAGAALAAARQFTSRRTFADPHAAVPYVEGLHFALEVYRERGLEGLTAALRAPPITTEQVLHPAKYLADPRETPARFATPDVAPATLGEWRELDSGILGEALLNLALRRWMEPAKARAAARGWDGSFYIVYRAPARAHLLLAMISSWDTAGDAAEFEAAWRSMAAARDGESASGHGADDRSGQRARPRVVVERRGRRVVVLDGVVDVAVDRLLSAFWQANHVAGHRIDTARGD